uniref:Uncharacterized protein n=1 Tax=Romanomermis culicivorax TaxID=13658 RepID=A0A915HYV3_ROMCU
MNKAAFAETPTDVSFVLKLLLLYKSSDHVKNITVYCRKPTNLET